MWGGCLLPPTGSSMQDASSGFQTSSSGTWVSSFLAGKFTLNSGSEHPLVVVVVGFDRSGI